MRAKRAAKMLATASGEEIRTAFVTFTHSFEGNAAMRGIEIDPRVLEKVRADAARIFGSVSRLDRWLCEVPLVGDEPRLCLLTSPTWVEELYDMLIRIERGVYA